MYETQWTGFSINRPSWEPEIDLQIDLRLFHHQILRYWT